MFVRTAVALLLATSIPAQLRSQSPAQPLKIERMLFVADSVAEAQVASGSLPGQTVAISHRGTTIFHRAYGMADIELDVPADTSTIFGITSVSKQITAALILKLIEAGKLSFDDAVTKFLPDYPVQGNHVTIRHLLNHTSGISPTGSTQSSTDPLWYMRDLEYPQMIDMFGKPPFNFKPGEKFEYNNMGYYLLGEIIGRVTGTPYDEYVGREMRALGLPNTMYCDARRIVPKRARSYEVENGKPYNVRYYSLNTLGGAGALCSTVSDLVRWTDMLHAGKVVSPASLRAMTAHTRLSSGDSASYGFGLYVETFEGRRQLSHGGTRPWGAYLTHYPDDALTIAVLTNSAGGGRERGQALERSIARAAFGTEPRNLAITADDIARHPGTYTMQFNGRTQEIRVFAETGALFAQLATTSPTRLRKQGDGKYLHGTDSEMNFVFGVDANETPVLTVRQGGRVMTGPKKN